MCPEKSFSWKMHFRQRGGSGDPYIICSQVSVDLYTLAPLNRKKSNYQWNNLQVRGPPVCAQTGRKSSELDPEESELVLKQGTLQLREQVSFLTRWGHGEPAGFGGIRVYRAPETQRISDCALACPGSPPA